MKKLAKKINLKHVAIIMDGNRRWAKEKFLPTAMGHQKGVIALKNAVKGCEEFGVKYLTVYAFSTENWNRKQDEVDFLMNLMAQTVKNELKELNESNVILNFLGDLTVLNPELQAILDNAVETTKNNTGVHLQIALNYGARNEIVNAVKKIAAQGVSPDKIDEKLLSEYLYTKDIPDPDLLIRTGGEMRVSNYLLWQIAYSEILVIPTYWPDFDENTLEEALLEFQNRQRRFGE